MEKHIGTDPNNPVRLYVEGMFDLPHYGHMRLFEQVKKKFPHVYLIAGICSDADCAALKYKAIMNEFERSETIRHCKWVDEIICPCPWVATEEFLAEHRIDFLCHDAVPYKFGGGEEGDAYAYVKRSGKFIATQRTEDISTTEVVKRILDNADYYSTKVLNSDARDA